MQPSVSNCGGWVGRLRRRHTELRKLRRPASLTVIGASSCWALSTAGRLLSVTTALATSGADVGSTYIIILLVKCVYLS